MIRVVQHCFRAHLAYVQENHRPEETFRSFCSAVNHCSSSSEHSCQGNSVGDVFLVLEGLCSQKIMEEMGFSAIGILQNVILDENCVTSNGFLCSIFLNVF